MNSDKERPSRAELAGLYPELSEEQLEIAEENLRRFVEVAIRICEQAEQDSVNQSTTPPLTDSESRSTIRSSPITNPKRR
ncbi:MAG: hypothetical protein AMXMBFR82_06970 [Candidatus Hydrogenedentota bacterium]